MAELPPQSQSMCIENKKRKRSINFSSSEQTKIIELYEKHRAILTSKQTNEVTNRKKEEVWKTITNSVNALGVCESTVVQVKDKWKGMQTNAKSVFSKVVRDAKSTGGGQQLKPPSETCEKIIDLLKSTPAFSGIEGGSETCPEQSNASSPIPQNHEDLVPDKELEDDLSTSFTDSPDLALAAGPSGDSIQDSGDSAKSVSEHQPSECKRQKPNKISLPEAQLQALKAEKERAEAEVSKIKAEELKIKEEIKMIQARTRKEDILCDVLLLQKEILTRNLANGFSSSSYSPTSFLRTMNFN